MSVGKKSFLVFCGIVVALSGVAFAVSEREQRLIDANAFYQNYLVTKDKALLNKAYLNYYQSNLIQPTSSGYLGMGMVFIEKKMNARAKKYLYKAYSIDEKDATVNYYLGQFSYQNEEYLKALDFYKRAYDNGLSGNYEVNVKIASIYEKLGDIAVARKFYEAALELNPTSEFCEERLFQLDSLEHSVYKYLQD